MPTSFWSHISYVIDQGRSIKPLSVLDVGVGNGKWGYLFREYLDIYGCGDKWSKDTWTTVIEGIELFEPYITKNPSIAHVYDKIHVGDVLEIFPTLNNYDLITMMDVLEHCDKQRGVDLVHDIINKSKMFILSVPLGDWRYQFKGENKAESHISIWTEKELVTYPKYKEHRVYTIPTSTKNVDIGVFIYADKC